ncbi:hypothetical protein POSPLADRAFT_1033931 [Postia placenta MAD-698-R-SB12]|uniref:DUF6533 domain-containing protein n=1 Tax=Postia placenta MAD-698-R-SB12 TaxID=670580 RepID=A0A1X6N0Z1_9APHY|nr:hypothetical protein POSPLADRAFT_1033931 [Postia placenta MAD-698-R-SB12]OSX62295.1 hypothetical protein POSPLADRAFT_1033931 [Postia placenta MAD-698-R-SB12]
MCLPIHFRELAPPYFELTSHAFGTDIPPARVDNTSLHRDLQSQRLAGAQMYSTTRYIRFIHLYAKLVRPAMSMSSSASMPFQWCSMGINYFLFPSVPVHLAVMATLAADPTFIEGFLGMLQKLGNAYRTSRSFCNSTREPDVLNLSVAAMVVMLYDYVLSFEEEVEYMWRGRFVWPRLLFWLNRYWPMLNLIYDNISLSTTYIADVPMHILVEMVHVRDDHHQDFNIR